MPSSLDLTGRASEDEPSIRQSQNRPSRRRRPPRNNCTTLALNPVQSALAPYLPCPLDLYNNFTPLSLIQLPIVSLIYILLQLPLHYNSTTATADTIHSLNENEWNVRVEQVNKLSKDMARAEKRVEGYTKDQRMIRRDVNDLKRRLGKLREKREAREEWVRVHGIMGAGDHDDLAGKKDD